MITYNDLQDIKKKLLKNVEPFAIKISPIFKNYNIRTDEGLIPSAQDIRDVLNMMIHALDINKSIIIVDAGLLVGYAIETNMINPIMQLNINYDKILNIGKI